MSIIGDAKEVVSLVQKLGEAELLEKTCELRDKVVELSADRLRLAEENASLKETLNLRAEMRFEHPFYMRDGWPHCSNCFDGEGKAVRVTDFQRWQSPPGFLSTCTRCGKSAELATLPPGVTLPESAPSQPLRYGRILGDIE